MSTAGAVAIVVAAIALYYGVLVRSFDRLAYRFALRHLSLRGLRNDDVLAVVNILVAGAFQMAVVGVLIMLLDLPLGKLVFAGFEPVFLLLAPLLALAEMAMAAMLASIVMAAAGGWQRWRGQRQVFMNWQGMMQAGWLRSFNRTHALLPRHAGALLFLVYLAFEEILFRGIALGALLPCGMGVAIMVSSLLFAAAQTAGMPSAAHALFPVAGALVMGPVHGYLALLQVPLAVLILTHLLFFLGAIGSAAGMAQAAAASLPITTRPT